MTTEEFFNKCRNADFHYQYIDDGPTYRRRRDALMELQKMSNEDPTFAAIYDHWYEFNHIEGPMEPPQMKDYL